MAFEPWGLGKISALSNERELELVLLLLLWTFVVRGASFAVPPSSAGGLPHLLKIPRFSSHLCILSVMEKLNLAVMNLIYHGCETVPFYFPDSLLYSL